MPNWPQWYPKLELKAEHLRGLEDFLLEPGRIEGNGFGVIVWSGESVRLERSSSGDALVVDGVRGITPHGQPVRIEPGSPLMLPLAAVPETFDLWVVVGPEASDPENDETESKQVLTTTAASHGRAIGDRPGWLYLGTYSNETALVLQTPPMPLCLGVLGAAAFDRTQASSAWDWDTWTAPLPRKLNECFGRVVGMSGPGMLVAAHELLLIAVDWSQIPVVRLASRLARVKRIIDWALANPQEGTLPSAPPGRFDWCEWQRHEVSVVNLPRDLADLLGEDSIAVAAAPKELAPKVGSVVYAERQGKELKVIQRVPGADEDDALYRAQTNAEVFDLKWCAPGTASRETLNHLLDVGSPGITFLWPLDLVSCPMADGFGFLRAVPAENMRSLGKWIAQGPRIHLRAAAWAGASLAAAFGRLHQRQLYFLNPTLDDLMLDTESGDLQILYSNNLGPISAPFNRNRVHAIMTPEVRSGYGLPGSESDEYILRALLYGLLRGRRPTFAVDESTEILDFALGGQAIPMPIDSSGKSGGSTDLNGSAPGKQPNTSDHWELLPGNLRYALGGNQSTGHLRDAGRSVPIARWIRMLSDFCDHCFECPHCGQSAVYGENKSADEPSSCVCCNQPLVLPPRLRIEGRVVVLGPGRKILPHHLASSHDVDFSAPVAKVVEHPSIPGEWGLLNLTNTTWVMSVNNKKRAVRPSRAAKLGVDMTIDFGGIVGALKMAGSRVGRDSQW